MSNIDLSYLVTADARAAQVAAIHAGAAKAECKRRILSEFPFEAQQNIAQAVAYHALAMLQGIAPDEDDAPARLSKTEIELAMQAQGWITAMQAACRGLSQDLDADPLSDTAWPALPKEVARLISRF